MEFSWDTSIALAGSQKDIRRLAATPGFSLQCPSSGIVVLKGAAEEVMCFFSLQELYVLNSNIFV